MAKTNIPEKGAIVQRDMETYLIHPHIPGGFVEPKLLRKIADVAEKYGAKYLKLTGAQRIAPVTPIAAASRHSAAHDSSSQATLSGPRASVRASTWATPCSASLAHAASAHTCGDGSSA